MSRGDSLRVDDYLGHIIEAICDARNKVTKHHGALAAAHPEIPWNFAYEMRNALSHGFFKVDQQVVWQTICDDLPGLRQAVQSAKN